MIEMTYDQQGVVNLTLPTNTHRHTGSHQILIDLANKLQLLNQENSCTLLLISHRGNDFNQVLGLQPWYCSYASIHPVISAAVVDVILQLESFPAPVILCISGGCFGLAMVVAGYCDVVLAEVNTLFSLANIGVLNSADDISRYVYPLMRGGLNHYDLLSAHRAEILGIVGKLYDWDNRIPSIANCKATILSGVYL